MNEAKIAAKQPAFITLEAGTYYWCACGRSKKQPFCDGSHATTDFTPHEFVLEKRTTVTLCGCKHTTTPPYCDGSHSGV